MGALLTFVRPTSRFLDGYSVEFTRLRSQPYGAYDPARLVDSFGYIGCTCCTLVGPLMAYEPGGQMVSSGPAKCVQLIPTGGLDLESVFIRS
jgi:hypothetical protein